LITHPARYCSRAAGAFRREILPVFASPDSPLRRSSGPVVPAEGEPEAVGEPAA
jgi:hypothetical protein